MVKSWNIKNLIRAIASCLLIVVAVTVLLYRQVIIDQIIVWIYSPTSQISTIANRAGLNEKGIFYFYASQPKLSGTSDFNDLCGRTENVTSILGCYADGRIYIYDVKDANLDGIREVTAAHEMLHAAYARLGKSEKQDIDNLLANEYQKIKDNQDFSSRMAFYSKTEPDQINNELHSVIGTEVPNIDPLLEEYFNKYFADRKQVTDLNQKYLNTFQLLKDRADSIRTDINNLVEKITQDSNQYNQDVSTLNDEISEFNDRANNGSFESQYQFNIERSALVNRANSLEATRVSINNDIASYESLLTQINSIATESKKLYNSIDSTLAPSPSI